MTRTLSDVQVGVRISNSIPLAILRQADIEPIPDNVIKKYMQEQLDAAPASDVAGRLLHRLGLKGNFLEDLLVIIFLVGVLAFIVGMIGVASSLVIGSGANWSLWTLGVGVGMVASVCLFVWAAEKNHLFIRIGIGPAYWKVLPAEKMGYLPPFVNMYMERILALDPTTRFEVADLRQEDYSLDPILFAVMGEERHAITVWKHSGEILVS